jgi:hypothetical protein
MSNENKFLLKNKRNPTTLTRNEKCPEFAFV